MRIRAIARNVLLAAAATVPLQAVAKTPVLEVGSTAPALALVAADGTQRSLAETEGPTVLIFYRGLW